MIPTPKTDLFIARFQNAANKISYFSVDCFDDAVTKNQFFRAVQESYLFLKYHLYGVYAQLPNIEEINDPRDLVYPDVLNYVLSQPITSYRSVGEEFYTMVPTPQDIETYLQVFRVKLRNISLPRRSSDYFVSGDEYRDEIESAIERGALTREEEEFLTYRLYVISLHLPRVGDSLVKMFQDYRKMGEPKTQRVEAGPSERPLHPVGSRDAGTAAAEECNSAHYEVNLAYVQAVYKFLSGDALPELVSKKLFVDCVQTANFKPIWERAGIKKTKLKYAIYCIGANRGDDWYKQSAQSIGCRPQQCSGATANLKWKKAIICIK